MRTHVVSLALIAIFALSTLASARAVNAAEPTKEELIRTLETLLDALTKKEFERAAKLLVVPENFQAERLNKILELREISAEGLSVLKRDAKFAKATDVFEEDRAKYFAERAKVDVNSCYGFNHKVGGEAGEVVAFWNGTAFRLVRVDDVGKLKKPTEKLSKEQLLAMLPKFEAAVAESPNDAAPRARYAFALYQVGNLPAAWEQLREAKKLDPKNSAAAQGVAAVIGGFEQRGLFTVGVPKSTIQDLLGPPERVLKTSWGIRWIYGVHAVELVDDRVHELVDLRGAKQEWFQPTEVVDVDLDGRGWTCQQRRKARGLVTALFYPAGQTRTDWQEQFEVERIVGGAAAGTPREIGELLLKQLQQRYADAKAKILLSDENSVYVAVMIPSADDKPRHQLVRLIRAEKDVHRISYTAKSDMLTREAQNKWMAIFRNAKLKPVEGKTPAKED